MVRLALLAFIAATFPAEAQMYKCVDERGVTRYSDQPSPGCKGGKVDIQSGPPLSDGAASRPEDLARQEAAFKRRQMERERAEAKEKRDLEQRCARLRREHDVLARVRMDDKARDARLQKVTAELRACP